jgi:uncharacterized protein YegP (UPF0339 family)
VATARFRLLQLSGGTVTWRLLATNNRDLGRGSEAYPSKDACWEAVRELQRGVAELATVLIRTGPSSWSWRIQAGNGTVAVASRHYQRRIQATQAAAVALELIPAAELSGLDPRAQTLHPRAELGRTS